MAKQLVGVVEEAWATIPTRSGRGSGSSRYLFNELRRKGLLHRAFGGKVSVVPRAVLMALSFSRERSVWRRQFYMDPLYGRALTQKLPTHPGLRHAERVFPDWCAIQPADGAARPGSLLFVS